MKLYLCSAAALLAAASPMAASASVVQFNGHFSNDTPTPVPNSTCQAGQVLVDFSPVNSTAAGTSNLGSFGPSQTHCIAPGQPYTGVFSFLFDDGAMFLGTTSGSMTPTATAGVFNSFNTYIVTSGTGRFLGTSGVLTGIGLLDRRPARPLNSLDVTGELNMPAVPEPTSWLMMLGGLGVAGATMRRRAADRAPATA